MLTFIGLGLNDEKDISIKGIEHVKSADYVYLEKYTSALQCSLEDLEKFYEKKVIPVEREFVEDGSVLLDQATDHNVALLIVGDVFAATTHMALYLQAVEQGIKVQIVHNASILTAVGITGLSLYKFGKTISMPFHETETVQLIKENYPLHTLCLLDLDPKEKMFMEASDAIARLIHQGFDPETKIVVCAQLGSEKPTIFYTEAKKVLPLQKFPQCLVIPGELHFMEEEALKFWRGKY